VTKEYCCGGGKGGGVVMLRPNRLGCAALCIAAGLFVGRLHIDHTHPQSRFVRNSTCTGPSEGQLFRQLELSVFRPKLLIKIFFLFFFFFFLMMANKISKNGRVNLFGDEKQFDKRQTNFYLFLRSEMLIKLMTTSQLLLNTLHI